PSSAVSPERHAGAPRVPTMHHRPSRCRARDPPPPDHGTLGGTELPAPSSRSQICGNIGSHVDITSGTPGTSSKMGNWEAMPTVGSQVRGHGLRCHPSNIEFGLWIRGAFNDCANPPI